MTAKHTDSFSFYFGGEVLRVKTAISGKNHFGFKHVLKLETKSESWPVFSGMIFLDESGYDQVLTCVDNDPYIFDFFT